MESAVGASGEPTGVREDPDAEILPLLVREVVDYAIFALDTDGVVATWNTGAERLKGYRAEEIVGHHFSRFYTEDDRRRAVPFEGLRHALEHGRWEDEGWRVRKDGSLFWANVVITALHDEDGRHRGFAKVTRDLTERKHNEDSLRQSLQLERDTADRLRRLDQVRNDMVALIAHDLRAPINLVQHLLDLLATEWDTSSEEEKIGVVDRVRARTRGLGTLVEDVLDLAHIEAGQVRVESAPLDLAPIIDQVVDEVTAIVPARTVSVTLGETRVVADAQRSWQVLMNLVSNAVKFSPPDSAVEITADRVGDEVVVAVIDEGPGIPAEHQHLLFQRFSRLPHSSGLPGNGIGLAIAWSLAEAQGGRLWVESAAGEGATFHLALPAAP